MKSFIQAIVGSIAALALAFAFRYVYTNALGTNESSNMLDEYGTLMLESRGLFLEHSEAVVDLTLAVHGMEGLVLLRGGDGLVYALVDGRAVPAEEAFSGLEDPEEAARLAGEVFSKTVVTASNDDAEELINSETHFTALFVTPDAVVIQGRAHPRGNVGVLYMKEIELSAGPELELIELVEEWQLFYVQPE